MREPHHPLTDHAFFCHRYFFPIDMMHLLECKGVSGLVFGSVLLWLTRDSRLGGNRDERLAAINTLRLLHYRARPGEVVLPKIYLSNITRDGWGNLSGPAYKAAITRHAAPFFRELVCRYCVGTRATDVCMRSIVVALDDMYTLLYQAPMFLTDDQELRFRTLVLDFGRPYTRLRELSRRSGVFGFSVTPKVHKVQHLPLLARCINPTRVQVYSEESMMGVVTKTWRGSARGRYKQHVQRIVLIKRLTGLLLRFELAL